VATASNHTTATCGGPCPAGSYCPEGTVVPAPCPADTIGGEGAASIDSCICPAGTTTVGTLVACDACRPGFFKTADGQCIQCDFSGVTCLDEGLEIAAIPIEPEFWRVSANSTAVVPCYTEGVCIGASAAQARVDNVTTGSAGRRLQQAIALDSSSTYGDALCRDGHVGPFCEMCAPDHYKDPTGLCNACDASGGSVGLTLAIPVVMLVLALVLGTCAACAARKKAVQAAERANDKLEAEGRAGGSELEVAGRGEPSGALLVLSKIGLSLIQVLTQIGTVFAIRFPNVFASVLRWLAVLQLDFLTLMPLDCVFPVDFHTSLLLRTLVPLVVMLVLAAFGFSALHMGGDKPTSSWTWLGNLLFNLVFAILFLIYPSISSKTFATFQCEDLDDGSSVLRADLRIDCDSDDHFGYVLYAALMVVVYPIGAPLLYSYLLLVKFGTPLRRLRDIAEQCTKLKEQAHAEDEYNRWDEATSKPGRKVATKQKAVAEQVKALEAEQAKLVAQLPGYIQSLSGNGYARRVFFFEIIECLRKLFIVCVPVFFPSGSTEQLLFALIVTFGTFGIYSALLPYGDAHANQYALAAQAIIFFSLLCSLAQPLDVGMDVMLTTLLSTFIALAFVLSAPCKSAADLNATRTSKLGATLIKLFSPRAPPSKTVARADAGANAGANAGTSAGVHASVQHVELSSSTKLTA